MKLRKPQMARPRDEWIFVLQLCEIRVAAVANYKQLMQQGTAQQEIFLKVLATSAALNIPRSFVASNDVGKTLAVHPA